MIPPQIGHNIFTISFIKFRFFHLYTLSWNHLCFDSIERIELNRWLNAQQISPAGNSHFGSASLNIETKIKMIAATDNPIPTSSNKTFSCFIPKSPLLNPNKRMQYRANGVVRSRAFFAAVHRRGAALNFFHEKHLHWLLISRHIHHKTAAILIATFSIKMLCFFIHLRRGQNHPVSLRFHIVFPVFHKLLSISLFLIVPINIQHGAKRRIIPEKVISQQAYRLMVF